MPCGKVRLDDCERNIALNLIKEIPNVFTGYDINEFEPIQFKASPGDAGYQIVKKISGAFMPVAHQAGQRRAVLGVGA
jgi:hypothetical protein